MKLLLEIDRSHFGPSRLVIVLRNVTTWKPFMNMNSFVDLSSRDT